MNATGPGSSAAQVVQKPEPLVFGTILFLSSELMFFGGLFAAYYTLRSQAAVWPPANVHLETVEPAIATGALVVSSVTMQMAIRRLRDGDHRGVVRWIAVTLLLGAGFLASQARGWITADFHISNGPYGTIFYAMTGFHGLHVLAGLLLMLVLLASGRSGRSARVATGEAVAYYWHFVDAVWLGLFATIYVIR